MLKTWLFLLGGSHQPNAYFSEYAVHSVEVVTQASLNCSNQLEEKCELTADIHLLALHSHFKGRLFELTRVYASRKPGEKCSFEIKELVASSDVSM